MGIKVHCDICDIVEEEYKAESYWYIIHCNREYYPSRLFICSPKCLLEYAKKEVGSKNEL